MYQALDSLELTYKISLLKELEMSFCKELYRWGKDTNLLLW